MHQPLPHPFQEQLDAFFRSMAGKNRSPKTILAYSTDLGQFLAWWVDNDVTVECVADIRRAHVIDFLAALSERKLTGVSRARKLAALQEFSPKEPSGPLREQSGVLTISAGGVEDSLLVFGFPSDFFGLSFWTPMKASPPPKRAVERSTAMAGLVRDPRRATDSSAMAPVFFRVGILTLPLR